MGVTSATILPVNILKLLFISSSMLLLDALKNKQ
jgi:hypothetical protein